MVVGEESQRAWWTFAGEGANASLAPALAESLQLAVDHDDRALYFDVSLTLEAIAQAIRELQTRPASMLLPNIAEAAISGLKFSECLPIGLAHCLLQRRLQNVAGIEHVLREEVVAVGACINEH